MQMEDAKALWTQAFLLLPLLVLIILQVWRSIIVKLWLEPRSLDAKIRSQGIKGPPWIFMAGNMVEIMKMRDRAKEKDMPSLSHDIVQHVLLEVHQWSKQYGKRYMYWWGTEPRIVVTEPELIREVLAKKVTQFEKSEIQIKGIIALIGRGLVAVNGDEWSFHRRIVAPAFYMEKIKKMVPLIAQCTVEMLDRWQETLQERAEIEVCSEFVKLTADIISHTAFGSNYLKGQKVFATMGAVAKQLNKMGKLGWVPGNRYLPLPANFRLRKLSNDLDSLLLSMIKERRASNEYGNDLLGLMLAECGTAAFDDRSVMEECKTFYLAGHETTAALLTWATLLLAQYPKWQELARAEAQEVCKGELPDADSISKFKLINMILLEAVRLYPPAILLTRACLEDTMLGDVYVPKGVAVMCPILAIQHDKELWGDDANEFNPERFKDGVAKASKHPNAFMAFSLGPRVCVGQSFALIEAKVALATFLQRFKFRLSPSYRHRPATVVTLKPYNGLPILLEKLENSD